MLDVRFPSTLDILEVGAPCPKFSEISCNTANKTLQIRTFLGTNLPHLDYFVKTKYAPAPVILILELPQYNMRFRFVTNEKVDYIETG